MPVEEGAPYQNSSAAPMPSPYYMASSTGLPTGQRGSAVSSGAGYVLPYAPPPTDDAAAMLAYQYAAAYGFGAGADNASIYDGQGGAVVYGAYSADAASEFSQ